MDKPTIEPNKHLTIYNTTPQHTLTIFTHLNQNKTYILLLNKLHYECRYSQICAYWKVRPCAIIVVARHAPGAPNHSH